jgi:hypothetical protein
MRMGMGTLLGFEVYGEGFRVTMVKDANEISSGSCWCPAPRHGQGHRKGAVFLSDTDRNHFIER